MGTWAIFQKFHASAPNINDRWAYYLQLLINNVWILLIFYRLRENTGLPATERKEL